MPKISKEAGFSPVVLIVIAVIALAGGGYFFMNKGGGLPSSSITPGVSLNPNCQHKDSDLCKFINNWKEIKDYSVSMVSTSKDGSKNESLYELSGEEKFHMLSRENGKENYNMITIGDTTYTKDYSDNKWWKQKASKEYTSLKNDVKFEVEEKEAVEDKTTYKSLGKESCGSRQCFKYQVLDPEVTDSTQYIWFDDKEYLLRRLRIESKDGSVIEEEISYNGVSISAPSPVKETKEDQIVLPNGGTVPGLTQKEMEDLQKQAEKLQTQTAQEPEPEFSSDEGEASE